MHHIEIETVWRFHKEGSPQTAVVMLGVLNEIRKTGKLTSAAKHAQLSYRHVWNLVEQWSEFFGVPLVETHRGKGTVLTAFGEKLVWAGERMQRDQMGPVGCCGRIGCGGGGGWAAPGGGAHSTVRQAPGAPALGGGGEGGVGVMGAARGARTEGSCVAGDGGGVGNPVRCVS